MVRLYDEALLGVLALRATTNIRLTSIHQKVHNKNTDKRIRGHEVLTKQQTYRVKQLNFRWPLVLWDKPPEAKNCT
jgi:hypothetical protein